MSSVHSDHSLKCVLFSCCSFLYLVYPIYNCVFSPMFVNICTFVVPFKTYILFAGMKVYVTEEKELIMEPFLKWAGNPNVTVVVKAFGLKATVQVMNQFFCLMRLDFVLNIERVDEFLFEIHNLICFKLKFQVFNSVLSATFRW